MQRRTVRFPDFTAVFADTEALMASGYDRVGNWGLAQVCDHMAIIITMSLDGYPEHFNWFIRMAARWIVLPRIFAHRAIHRRLNAPAYLLPADTVEEAAAVERLREVVRRFEAHTGPMKPSPVFGDLTPEQWREVHLWHCEHHFSFLLPQGELGHPFPLNPLLNISALRYTLLGEFLMPLAPRNTAMRLCLSSLLIVSMAMNTLAAEKDVQSLFDGKTFAGWEGDTKKTWRIEEGAIVGGSLDTIVPRNEFLCTTKTFGDFELKVKFKLVGDRKGANAGVQFRTKRIPKHHEVSGYQADAGQGYWGALYDESRRNKVLAGPDKKLLDKIVKLDDWNEYVIRCQGPRIQLWLNGTLTVDFTEKDDKIERTGIIGLQIHGGAKAKVFYKDITIKDLTPARTPQGDR